MTAIAVSPVKKMADQDEVNEIKAPKPESIEDQNADISSDSEDGEDILRQIEMEINLRIYTPRQVRNAPVAATMPADESNISKMDEDDKVDQNKSNSPPNKIESAAPHVAGVGRGRGRGRAMNPPSSAPEPATSTKGPFDPEPATSTKGPFDPEPATSTKGPFDPEPATSTKGPSTAPDIATLKSRPSAAQEPVASTKEPSAAPEVAPWMRGSLLIEKLMLAWDAAMGDFLPYDSSDHEDLPEEVGEASESAVKKEATETAVALRPPGLGRGRGCGRPVEPTPPSPRSPITDEDLAAPKAASRQVDDAREFTPPERRTQERGKESDTSSKNEETAVGALPKPGFGRGRGRAKEKPSSPTPRASQSQSARESSPQHGPAQKPLRPLVERFSAEASVSPQPGTSQPKESQHVPWRHPFYDRGYEIEEPVVARFGRSELLETFTQHDCSFDGPMKVTASYIPIKEANAILRKAREEEKKNPSWVLFPVADERKSETEIEDADDEDIPNPYK